MAKELNPKDKEALATLYDYPEFSALKKWNEVKRLSSAEKLLKIDMSAVGSDTRAAFLQGQAYAHEFMLLELKKIHKDISNKA